MRPPILSALAAIALSTLSMPSIAATCRGEDPCTACHDCSQCNYCTSGRGSCSILRNQTTPQRQKALQKAQKSPTKHHPKNPRR